MYDIAVIGAGLAGLQCSRLLALRGLRVLLVDRKASVADGIQTTGIFVRRTWEDFPLPDEQLGRPIRDVRLYSPSRRMLALTAPQDEFRIGRMAWLSLYLLEQCARAGVVWRPATRLAGWEPCGRAGLRLVLEHGCRSETLDVRYVIGADGPRSFVARAFGLDRNREMLIGLEDVFAGAPPGAPALHCYLDPRLAPGYIAWVAHDGQETHVGVGGCRERFDPAVALAAFRSSLAGQFELRGPAIERRGGLIPVGGILRRIACRHALLAGDAAGAVSPLTAGGLDPALRLSTFASEVVAEYLERGDASVLRQYTGDRFRARFIARKWMRKVISSVRSPLAIELGCALLRTGPLRALAAHVFFGRGSFPDVALLAKVPPLVRHEHSVGSS